MKCLTRCGVSEEQGEMTWLERQWVRVLDLTNRRGKGLAVRLVQWTGKSPHRIHPKHLVADWEARRKMSCTECQRDADH